VPGLRTRLRSETRNLDVALQGHGSTLVSAPCQTTTRLPCCHHQSSHTYTTKVFQSHADSDVNPAPKDDPPTNVLVLLHGLGDGHDAFATLGKQMNLPETACVSVRGPKALLDLEGAHWGDDIIFDSTTGGLDADSGLKESTELLRILIKEVLVEKCGYAPREIVIFGFGQGGMVALSTARKSRRIKPYKTLVPVYLSNNERTVAIQSSATNGDGSNSELGGVISIGAPVPSEAPAALVSKCKTPVLVCAGSDRSAVTSTAEDKLKRLFEFLEVKRYRKSGDSMPSNRDEMMPIMQLFSRRLRSTKGVPKGSVEIA
jgi:predicted esterase